MQPTCSTKCSQVISLLNDGYSLHQIEAKTHLWKSTIGTIKKEMNVDKENSKGGHPSKFSYCDKQSIIHQITTGKLDNAVQAIHFINNTLHNPITPQAVRNSLKENNSTLLSRKKAPPLKKGPQLAWLRFSQYHE